MVSVAVEVLAVESDDLVELVESGAVTTGHALDGTTVATAVFVLTPPILLTLRTWLNARVEQRKQFSVSFKGRKMTGYTAKEVEKLVQILQRELDGER